MSEEQIVYLSKDQIKKCQDREVVDVEVDEWDGIVSVRPLTMMERRVVRSGAEEKGMNTDGTEKTTFDAELLEVEAIIMACVNPKFTPGDRDWLMETKSSGALSTISKVIFDISGLGVGSEKKSKRKTRKRS